MTALKITNGVAVAFVPIKALADLSAEKAELLHSLAPAGHEIIGLLALADRESRAPATDDIIHFFALWLRWFGHRPVTITGERWQNDTLAMLLRTEGIDLPVRWRETAEGRQLDARSLGRLLASLLGREFTVGEYRVRLCRRDSRSRYGYLWYLEEVGTEEASSYVNASEGRLSYANPFAPSE